MTVSLFELRSIQEAGQRAVELFGHVSINMGY